MSDPKVVHPTPEDGIDILNHLAHWLTDVLSKDFPELGKERVRFFIFAHIAVALLVAARTRPIFKSRNVKLSRLSWKWRKRSFR